MTINKQEFEFVAAAAKKKKKKSFGIIKKLCILAYYLTFKPIRNQNYCQK